MQFIRENMHVATVPLLPEIRLYTAHRSSGLSRLADPDDDSGLPPYWAYQWAGGMVLARYIFDRPETSRAAACSTSAPAAASSASPRRWPGRAR